MFNVKSNHQSQTFVQFSLIKKGIRLNISPSREAILPTGALILRIPSSYTEDIPSLMKYVKGVVRSLPVSTILPVLNGGDSIRINYDEVDSRSYLGTG